MIPFTVTIDTEEEWDWSGPFPRENLCVENIGQLPDFQQRCDTHRIRPTYLVNHAVLSNVSSRQVIAGLAANTAVEIGMHLHPWNTPPLCADSPDGPHSFTHNLPAESIQAKLESTWKLFEAMGLNPTSFRGGRYSAGPVVQRFLVEHGFLVDASVCPFTSWHDPGAPNYRDRDLKPRRAEIAGRYLWELPLTLAFTREPYALWARVYHTIQNTPLRYLRLIGVMERLNLVKRVWLNFECESAVTMLEYLRRVERLGSEPICFTVHSSSLAAGPGPYCRTVADRQRIYQGIEQVFEYLAKSTTFQSFTLSELARHLNEKIA